MNGSIIYSALLQVYLAIDNGRFSSTTSICAILDVCFILEMVFCNKICPLVRLGSTLVEGRTEMSDEEG